MINIVTGDPRPIFRQVVDGIKMKIVGGELPSGTRLPSVRSLAMQLMINVNTVAKAYTELTAEGLIEPRKGVGAFVCERTSQLSEAERDRRLDEALQQFMGAVVALGFGSDEIIRRVDDALSPFAIQPKRG